MDVSCYGDIDNLRYIYCCKNDNMELWEIRELGWKLYCSFLYNYCNYYISFCKENDIYNEKNKILPEKVTKIIQYASTTMFGIYLFENILEALTNPLFNLLDRFIPRIFTCNIWIIVTMLMGSIIVGLLKKIPGLKKLL